jgi:hypothetical protein
MVLRLSGTTVSPTAPIRAFTVLLLMIKTK